MLIEPASKVSVPLTVVMRTRSRVPDVVFDPPPQDIAAVSDLFVMAEYDQTFDPNVEINAIPCLTDVAAQDCSTENPVVMLAALPAVCAPLKYPVVSGELFPICICIGDIPDVLTPTNITVMRFTQLGIPVKSIEVPEVDATEVP